MNTKRLRLEKEAQDHIDQVINESSSEASTDLINRLPSVCLAEIFMCLDIFDRLEVRKVCSNWKNTCDHQGWNDIKKFECKPSLGRTYNNRKMLQSDVSDVLSYCGRYLRQLKLSEFCDSSIMLLVHQTCINLTHLEIFFDCYHMLLDENHYAEAFISMIMLRSIKIQQNCVEGQPDLTFPTYVLNNLPEEINEIVVCIYDDKIYQLDFPLFLVDLEKFNELRRLDIKNYILTKDTMKEIAKKTTLVNLMLRSCIIENEDAELIFNPMNLESLEFSKGRVNKECITRTVNNCKVLKNLLVNLSSFDIKQITKLDKLKCLNLSHVDDLSITKIVSNLENLVELQLNCKNLSSDALQKISYLKELEWLVLSHAYEINNNNIISISNKCNKLKKFGLSRSKYLSSYALCELSNLTNLEILNLNKIDNVDDNVLTSIASKCQKIKTLGLKACYKLTEIGLEKIGKLKNLEIFAFHENYNNIPDTIFKGLYNIKELYCGASVKLTADGLIMLIKNCKNLKLLDNFPHEVNHEVISCAVEETRRRTNNTLLTITMMGSEDNLSQFNKLSPLLKLTEYKTKFNFL